MIKELLTRDDFYNAILAREGVIVVMDAVQGPHSSSSQLSNTWGRALRREDARQPAQERPYYLAGSCPEAQRELDAQPCHCA
jgi:hypothetical protein